jgi:WD40 repeat protein
VPHTALPTRLVFSPDGRLVAMGSMGDGVRVWNVVEQREALHIGHQGTISDLAFNERGGRLATASGDWFLRGVFPNDGTARLWDLRDGREFATLAHGAAVNTLTFDRSGRRLATGGGDRVIRIWDVDSGRLVATLEQDTAVAAVAFNPDDSLLATASISGRITVWRADRWTEVATMAHENLVTGLVFAQGSRWLASGSWDHSVRLWDASRGREFAKILHPAKVSGIAVSGDGRRLVSGDWDGVVRVHVTRTADLVDAACARLSRNLTREEWQRYLGSEPYRPTCQTSS